MEMLAVKARNPDFLRCQSDLLILSKASEHLIIPRAIIRAVSATQVAVHPIPMRTAHIVRAGNLLFALRQSLHTQHPLHT